MKKFKIEYRSESKDREAFSREFTELPARVRSGVWKKWMAPLQQEFKMLSFPYPNPIELFLLRDTQSHRSVGRIGANLSPHHPDVGYTGFFEIDLTHPSAGEGAQSLLQTVSLWMKKHGAGRMFGPVDLSTWFTYRFRTDSGNHEQGDFFFSWEPTHPPEYPRLFEQFEMKPVQHYHSQGFSAPSPKEKVPGWELAEKAYLFATTQGFKFRPFDLGVLESRELPLLHQLSHECFKDAFLFEPVPLPVFQSLYAAALKRFDFSLSRFIVAPSGEEVGFFFAFIDRDYFVVKTIGVLDAYRNLKLSTAALHPVIEGAAQRGIHRGVSALVKSGASSEHHEKRHTDAGGLHWRHDYTLFGKDLE